MEQQFDNSQYGNGKFGKWFTDLFELPAYEYTNMQSLDPIAKTNTSGKDSTDHWHQVGNDRITLTAHNGGYMQFLIADRGLQWISYHDLLRNCLGGGICFIEKDNLIRSDLYNSKMSLPQMYRRIFGCGYFQKFLKIKDLDIEHFIYPPFGDDPVVLSEILITNNSNKTLKVCVYEFWGIRIRHLIGSILSMLYMTKDRTKFGNSKLVSFILRLVKNILLFFHLGSEQIRDKFSSKFIFNSSVSNLDNCLILTPSYKFKIPVEKDQLADRNYYPNPIFLKSFEKDLPIKYYNYIRFKKSVNIPYKIERKYQSKSGSSPCLMMGHELTLKPQESKCLRFLFGTAEPQEISNLIKKYEILMQNNFKVQNFKNWKENLIHFSTNSNKWLSRELTWHSYYLRSAQLFDNYFNNHYLPQGNAYTFLHGVNGAVRDYVLFLLPMIYLNPDLAREMLEFILRNMNPSGKLPYATMGIGKQMGALVHESSSDLHLFLLWGLLEYLYTTRDFQFLDKKIPFYPLTYQKSSTVFNRILLSLKFIFKNVGIGPHGLIKVGSGDWSDGISLFVKNRGKFIKNGESTFNSALMLYIIPLIIELFQKKHPRITNFLTQKYEDLKKATLNTWNGKWCYRGWDGSGNPIGNNNLFLEHHIWLLLSGILAKKQTEILINNIYKILDLKSKTGQYILYPPKNVLLNILPRGWDVNGGIWHAMNFLLTWAYSKNDINKGFQSLLKNSMTRRAEVYSHIWYGIWSGSDSYNADYASNPGQTFIHPATPQTDFPIMNLNLHANLLNSLIKLVGINSTLEGIIIDPRVPFDTFHFKTPTLELNIREKEIIGFYKPLKEDSCIIKIRKPTKWSQRISAWIDEQQCKENFSMDKDWLLLKVVIPEKGINFSLKML